MFGCCLIITGGTLAGFVLGGIYGIQEYNAAVTEDMQQGGPGDFLPVGIPIWACIGTVLGALASGLLMGIWRPVARRLGPRLAARRAQRARRARLTSANPPNQKEGTIPGSLIKRIAASGLRAIVGALAGFVIVAIVTLIATDYFGSAALKDSAFAKRLVVWLFGVGAALGAIVAVLFGPAPPAMPAKTSPACAADSVED